MHDDAGAHLPAGMRMVLPGSALATASAMLKGCATACKESIRECIRAVGLLDS